MRNSVKNIRDYPLAFEKPRFGLNKEKCRLHFWVHETKEWTNPYFRAVKILRS
jgi:hypothetical protein